MKRQYVTLFSIMALLLATAGTLGAQEAEPKALVVTGTAVNASPDEIIVKTETGEEVFLIEKEDLYPEPIAEGSEVTVWFVERGGYNYATKLEVGEQMASAGEMESTADADSSDTMTGSDVSADASLPETASAQPLLALLGLIGLAGAAVVWRVRS